MLDLKYTPLNPLEAQVFDAQQNYIYTVLLNTIKDSFLKSIIINHNNRKVQECWEKIITACDASTVAEIKANSLLQYIMSVKFDDGKWRETSKDFIIHWCKQLRQYGMLCGKPGTVAQFANPSRFRCSRTLWMVSKSFDQYALWHCTSTIQCTSYDGG